MYTHYRRNRVAVGLDLVNQTDLVITKDVSPSGTSTLGDTVVYTIANNGAVEAAGVVLTDELPTELTFGGYLTNPGGTAQLPDSSGVITWEYPVAGGVNHSFVFSATVSAGTAALATDVTNVAGYTSTYGGSGSDDAIFGIRGYEYVYLPLIMRGP